MLAPSVLEILGEGALHLQVGERLDLRVANIPAVVLLEVVLAALEQQLARLYYATDLEEVVAWREELPAVLALP